MQEFQGSSDEIRQHIDSPQLIEALDYWETLRGEAALPCRAAFDPMAIAQTLPNVLLLDVLPADRFVYRLAGGEIERRYKIDSFAGKTPHETLGGEAEKVLRPYRSIRDSGCLVYRNADKDWLRRDPRFKAYKALLLPLGGGNGAVSAILGVFDFFHE